MSALNDGPHWPGKESGNPVHDLVAAFIVMDIQHSPDWADDLMRRLAQVADGELTHWSRLGNAYELVLTPERVTIEETAGPGDSEPVEVPPAVITEALAAWIEQIR